MSKFIKLMCFMLCLTMLLSACGTADVSSNDPVNESSVPSEPSSEEPSSEEPSSQTPSEEPSEPETDPLDGFVPVFRAVACSDVHVSSTSSVEAARLKQLFTSTYKYASGHDGYNKLDAVFVVGDFTNYGNADEYRAFKTVIDANIKEETTLITVMGNHEYYGGGQSVYLENIDDKLDKHIVVNGFHFIGLSPYNGGDYSSAQITWLKDQLAQADADDPGKPIFTFQHHHLQNTVYVSKTWYTGSSSALFSAYNKYSQVINFSGHSHGPVNNPLSIWQNKFTALGTGTLSYFEMETGMTNGTIPAGANKAAQYYIIEVDAENRVRILPYNLLTDIFFKTPASTDSDKQLIYSIDNLKDPSSFLYTSARGTNAAAPYFTEEDTMEISNIKTTGFTVKFTQADDDSCVYNYNIVCTPKAGGASVTAKFFSEYYFEPMPETVEYTVSRLEPDTEYNVEIYAVNVWGKVSEKPISQTVKTKYEKPVIYESANPVKYIGTFTDFESIKELVRSDYTVAYGGKANGDVFAGDWCGSSSWANSKAAIVDGKGYNGSKALEISSPTKQNGAFYVLATNNNKNTTIFPRFGYIRVWVDFTDIDFRKASFGLVSSTGGLYTTDDNDGQSGLKFYYMADGTDQWKEMSHGGDGCFGVAEGSSVSSFKGWMAFPVADMLYRTGTGSGTDSGAFSENSITGVYLYWDYSGVDLVNKPFYVDEIQLVADYKVFTEYKK